MAAASTGTMSTADRVDISRQPGRGSVGWLRRAFGADALSTQALMIGYGAAIVTADALIANQSYLIGAGLLAATLAALIIQGAAASIGPRSSLLWAFALVPTSRLVSLVLPLTEVPFILWYWIVGAVVGLGAIAGARAIEATPRDLGLRIRPRWILLDLMALPLGLALGLVAYAILRPPGWAANLDQEAVWFPALTVVSASFVEELIYRGLLVAVASNALGITGLLWVTAVATTAFWGAPAEFLLLLAVANLLFCLIRLRTGSLLGPVLAHSALNTGLYIVGPAFASELFPYIVGAVGCQPLLEGFC